MIFNKKKVGDTQKKLGTLDKSFFLKRVLDDDYDFNDDDDPNTMQVPNKTKKINTKRGWTHKSYRKIFWNCRRRRRWLGIVIVRRSEKILVAAFVEIDFLIFLVVSFIIWVFFVKLKMYLCTHTHTDR